MSRRSNHHERGAAAVMLAILLLVIGGFMALALNVGHMMSVRGELQNATDAAALAGAAEIDGTTTELTKAPMTANTYAAEHWTDNHVDVALDASADITMGHWDFVTRTFSPKTATMALDAINAIQVHAARDAAHQAGPLDVFFNVFLGGTQTVDVGASSVAVRGGPCNQQCAFPFVFADCQIQTTDPSTGPATCNPNLTFRSDIADSFGMTSLSSTVSANTDSVDSILKGTCPGAVTVGDTINVSNGSNLNPLISDLTPYVGKTVIAPIVHVDGCPNPQFNQAGTVVGFAAFTIVSVNPPPSSTMTIDSACNVVSPPSTGGCAFFGAYATQPLLVK